MKTTEYSQYQSEDANDVHEKLPFALNNGTMIRADEYTSGNLECPGCKQAMYFRKRHKRKLSSMICNVRCTFVHANKTSCESYEHRTAKTIIASTLPLWNFTTSECSTCGVAQTLRFSQGCVEETPFGRFKLDVGVVDNTNIIGCVEIYKSHRVDAEKKQHLDSTIEWVEVKAVDVLDAFLNKQYTLESLNKTYICCASCKERKREESERSRMQDEEWRTQEYNEIMQMRKSMILPFGKHRGQSVAELVGGWGFFEVKDWWYLRYLAGYAGSKFYHDHFPIPKRIQDEAQTQLRGSCLICEEECDSSWKLLCTGCWRTHRGRCLRCDAYVKPTYTFCCKCKNKMKSN